uniref:Uncharacterized protein n=1 Tax=Arundo donax TaxID=35708 RepID=A0A0A8YWC7_ARUDO
MLIPIKPDVRYITSCFCLNICKDWEPGARLQC